MAIHVTNLPDSTVTCSKCRASCCKLEVLLITETGVPEQHILRDAYGGETMLRLDDGWCSALNRENFLCTIYDNRPLICREFEMGAFDCIKTRAEDA
ncbi:YkgJ family cysteine cluster protein [Pseudomonadales bacterium]|nr:YkgJ family cysteine cluster protein [Pseudomonadales bacterium]MDG0999358.1 YkgJ family cysteine cluster protein [Pseudomonadales bacterium]MDG1911066.1 YkgJ family cysteine cluster protein [Pseudomonadales bacterium]